MSVKAAVTALVVVLVISLGLMVWAIIDGNFINVVLEAGLVAFAVYSLVRVKRHGRS
ncbi:hypothetical protein FHX82_002779 [Amycolatopsis bartoniae]|uniref:Uncharacterized protein n=1 Tax=Amycolatopsis bartoniae TaxID=941986 RepID=A0A8H9IWF5_9PSEU|nr:hypothetical protein [Amycolatopsis bartoniae]MBB2935725.1 hypothetical protein [Amycolatopsis bartoniae]GHF61432.1 hypothetical protein GCM10017566_38560 [Amycolatopsis bartoniae]